MEKIFVNITIIKNKIAKNVVSLFNFASFVLFPPVFKKDSELPPWIAPERPLSFPSCKITTKVKKNPISNSAIPQTISKTDI